MCDPCRAPPWFEKRIAPIRPAIKASGLQPIAVFELYSVEQERRAEQEETDPLAARSGKPGFRLERHVNATAGYDPGRGILRSRCEAVKRLLAGPPWFKGGNRSELASDKSILETSQQAINIPGHAIARYEMAGKAPPLLGSDLLEMWFKCTLTVFSKKGGHACPDFVQALWYAARRPVSRCHEAMMHLGARNESSFMARGRETHVEIRFVQVEAKHRVEPTKMTDLIPAKRTICSNRFERPTWRGVKDARHIFNRFG